MRRIKYILVLIILSLSCAYAQKIRDASGEAQFRLEDDMSKIDLKEKLRHHAIINAIEREYGTYVSQESFVEVEDGKTEFRVFGKNEVRGEWLKTTREVFKDEFRKPPEKGSTHELWMSLKIQGKVREFTRPDIAFDYFTTNCRKEACRTSIFESGQPLYFHFKTPVDGYLSVFIIENNDAYRILPYQNMPERFQNAVPVDSDKSYVFFSPENDYYHDFSRHLIDELVMIAEQPEEYITLCLVFSPGEFDKPGLEPPGVEETSGWELPKSLNAEALKEWLETNRINDVNFYYRKLKLKIVK
ncbi:MAG: hypothetical protein ACNS62_24735 [Candidatus Cyclobacteriaceae bacterium M3_2C_046]